MKMGLNTTPVFFILKVKISFIEGKLGDHLFMELHRSEYLNPRLF
jgi:hypothetical protein